MKPRHIFAFFALVGIATAQNGLRDIPDPDTAVQEAGFRLPDNMEVNLFASDPMISKPVQMNWDAAGRLWLVSSPLYPHIEPLQDEQDQVLVLEDTNSDGAADKVTTFADGLYIPTAVIPGDGGAYVANSTEILHLRDTDGDLKADERRVMLSGFGTEDTHHLVHTFRHGPDGMLYFCQSIYIHSHIETPYGIRRLLGGGVWHFRPETQQLEVLSKGLINPWGYAFDRYGQTFATDGAGSEGINFIFPRSVFRTSPGATRIVSGLNPGQPKLCGLEVLSGSHVPEALRGQMISPDFRGHRVNTYKLAPSGSFYSSTRQADFLASIHRAFRPIDVKMGPDGAIYIADWYNPIIQHGEVDFRDPRRDHVHGRIWRVTFKDRPLVKKPDIPGASVDKLLGMLTADEDWTRHFVKRELRHRGAGEVLGKLDAWAAKVKTDAEKLEALWTYQSLNRLNPTLLEDLFASKDSRYRAAALRVLYHRHHDVYNTKSILDEAISDENGQVRLWAVSVLAQLGGKSAVETALKALDKPMDEMLDFALWSLVREHEAAWLPAFIAGDLKFDGRINHLIFAASAIGKPVGMPQIFAALEGGNLSDELSNAATQFVGKSGSPKELARLLALTKKAPARQAAILDALTEAKKIRKLQPAGELGAILPMLKSDNTAVLQKAAVLAGIWKVPAARATLEEVFLASQDAPARMQAAAEGLRYVGGGNAAALFEKTAQTAQTDAAKAISIRELANMSPERGAKSAVAFFAQSKNGQDPHRLFDTLIRTPQTVQALTKALANAKLPQEIAITGVQRASTSGKKLDALVKALQEAGGLKPMTQTLSPAQMAAMVDKVNKQGNPHRGEEVYRRAAGQCILCHAIGGSGGKIGPDLVSIGASAPVDYLITSLLNPNDKIKEGYHMTLITTKSGASFAGGVESESSAEMVLRDSLGSFHRIAKSDIKTKVVSPVSMMPAGLTASLREDEFIDLVRFLSELGKEGDFKVQPTSVIRKWAALQPHERTRDEIGHYGESIFAEEFAGYQWTPVYSKVNGELSPSELPLVMGRGKNRWGVVRFEIDQAVGTPVVLKINDTNLMHLFVGEKRLTLPENGAANLPIKVPAAGTKFTLAVNSAYRPSPIRVEVAEEKAKAIQRAQPVAAKGKGKGKPKSLKFRAQQLHKDNIEGIAVGDLDNDGDLDIAAGERYYLNPDFKPQMFRRVLPFGKDYMQDNGDHLWDVNGDGFLDVVSGQFTETKVHWFENPKVEALKAGGKPWVAHLLVDTETSRNEATFMRDMDGDKVPEWIENSWDSSNPMLVWKLAKDAEGTPTMVKATISESGNGHGQGFGDINGDGLEDIIFMQGWYERPAENPWGQTWKWHQDFVLPHASCPILVMDVNGDGRNDFIWGDGHNYGVYWHEQLLPREDGTTLWKQHLIDKKFSQAHSLAWADLDNDGAGELITGKRYYAHSGGDKGAEDEIVINYYKWQAEQGKWTKFEAHKGQAGTGLQIRVADLNGDGWKEIIVPGKSGTHILWNEGTGDKVAGR